MAANMVDKLKKYNHEYIVIDTKFVSLSCLWADIWLLWFGGQYGRHLGKEIVVEIKMQPMDSLTMIT